MYKIRIFATVFIFIFLFLAGILVISSSVNISTGEIIKAFREGRMHNVEITNFGFDPEILYAHSGDKVIWINRGKYPQTITSKYWGSELLVYNDRYSITIDTNNSIDYFSIINKSFKGKIIFLKS